MNKISLQNWQRSIAQELKENLLAYWIKHTQDSENGGFYGRISNNNQVHKDAPKSLILNTRILWTFSAAYKKWKNPDYLEIANRAYNYLIHNFIDSKYNGVYWMLDYRGNPVNDKKKSYGQAFFIYSLSEYYKVDKNPKVKDLAINYFKLLLENIYDDENGGYFETCNRNWSLAEDLRLSDKDMNEKKSMNNHLHMLEAFTNLYRIWPDPELEDKLRELIGNFLDYIICPETYHFKLFFNECWNTKSRNISFGHDIEGSWLLCEAAEVLEDRKLLDKIHSISLKMVDATIMEGFTDKGAVYYEKEENGDIVEEIDWWPQAEAVVGLLNAFQISQDNKYLDLATKAWNFIDKYIKNKKYGEWFYKVKPDGEPCQEKNKVSEWKGPYHGGRACMESIERLEKIISIQGE